MLLICSFYRRLLSLAASRQTLFGAGPAAERTGVKSVISKNHPCPNRHGAPAKYLYIVYIACSEVPDRVTLNRMKSDQGGSSRTMLLQGVAPLERAWSACHSLRRS